MKRKTSMKLIALALFPAGLIASAQTTYYWDSNSTTAGFGNTSGTWGTSTFWGTSAAGTGATANTTITSVDTVNFGTATLNYANATIGVASGGVIVGDIVIGAGQTTAITALGTSGNAITIHNGITKNSGSAAVTITSPVTLGGNQTWLNNSSSALAANNGANLITNGGFNLTVDGTGATNFGVINNAAATLSGSGNLIKNGTGLFSFGGTNAGFSGNVTVNGGTMRVNAVGSIGSGNLTLNGGVYEEYWTSTFTRTLGSGAGQIQILGGTSGFSENGATGMNVKLNNNAAYEVVWGSAYFAPSTLVLQAATAQNSSSLTFENKIDLNGADRTIFTSITSGDASGSATISGVIRNSTGTAGLVKTGSGRLNLTAVNTYNGATTVNQGILTATVTGALPGYATPGNVVVAANATIAVRTGAWTAGNIDSLRGAATWSANTSRLGLDTTAGAFTYSSNITEALTLVKLNGNNLTLTGASTYTGKTLTNGGGILVGSIGNIGLTSSPLGVNNTFIDFIGSTGELEYNGAGETSNRLIDISGTAGTIRTTSNTGALVLSGAINPTSTSNKTLTLLGTSTLNNTISGNISNGAGGTLGVTKSLAGTWILSGSNSYTGATTFAGGTLIMVGSGALSSASTLTNGSASSTLHLQRDSGLTLSNAWSFPTRNVTNTIIIDRETSGASGSWTFSGNLPQLSGNTMIWQKGGNITNTPTVTLSGGMATSDSTAGTIKIEANGVNLIISGTISNTRVRTNEFSGNTDGNQVTGHISQNNSYPSSVNKTGSGTWVLAGPGGSNYYSSTTTVTAGTLQFGKNTALYNNLSANWTDTNLNVKSGATLAFNVGGTNEFTTGNITTLLTNLASSGSATTGMNAGSNYGFDTTNASGGTFTIADVIADSTGASGGARGLIKLGTGELVLTNTNTHTGTTTVKAGTLTLGHATDTLANAPVTVDGSGATLAIGANSDTVGVVTLRNGSITGTGGTLTGSSYAVESGSISAILGGSGTLTKTTAGTVTLSGANALSGAVTVTSGTLQLSGSAAAIASTSGIDLGGGTLLISNTAAANNSDRLNNSGTVTLSGSGVLNFSHTGGAANYSETTGALSVTGSGNQIITSRADVGQTSTLTFASLTLGGGLQFTGNALGLDSRNRIFITGQSAGPIGGSATYFDPLNNVTTPAAYTLLNGVGPQGSDVDVDVLGGVIPDGSAAVSIIQAGTSGNITLGSPVTSIDSLTQKATQAGTLELAGEILRTDLVIIGNPNAPLTIGTTPGEGTITPNTVSGSLTLNNNYAAPLLVINSVIANNGSGSSLLKTGAGTVQITAGATYTGGTVVGAGTVTLTGAGALPDTSAVDLSDPSSVLHLSGISASSETIGSLTGVGGSSVVIGGKTLALNGASPAPFAGVISGSGGGLTLLAGATQELTGDNTFTGDVTIGANASLSVNKIQTSGAQPLGQGTSSIVMQGNIGAGSTLTYTGAGAGATNRGLTLTGGQGGTVNVTAGTLTVNGTLAGSANFHKAGAGTMVLSGASSWNANGFVNAGTLVLGGDSSPGSNSLSAGNWAVASGATMRLNTTGALETSTLTRNGTFNLEAGTLRTNSIDGSGAFVWGAGTITPLSNLTEGSTDRTDPGGSPNGPVVREGTILDYSGNLATSNGSTLDLGGLFTDNGLRYNQISVSGSLSLAATDALNITINPYLLRPNTYTSIFTGDWGTLRLVMADSITGSFDTITGLGTDAIGFTADPGSGGTDSFINPATLAMNTYYIEYRTSGVLSGAAVLFHYKVAGSVPEPGSAGLLIAGASLIRMLRRRSDNEGADIFQRRRKMIRRRRSPGRR